MSDLLPAPEGRPASSATTPGLAPVAAHSEFVVWLDRSEDADSWITAPLMYDPARFRLLVMELDLAGFVLMDPDECEPDFLPGDRQRIYLMNKEALWN